MAASGRESSILHEAQCPTLSNRGHPVHYEQNAGSSALFVFEETEEQSNLPETHSKYEAKKGTALCTGYWDGAVSPRQLI